MEAAGQAKSSVKPKARAKSASEPQAATPSAGEPPAATVEHEGDPNASMVFTVGIVGAILLLALLIFGVVLFQNAQALQTEEKVFAGKPVELAEQQTLQLAGINQYRYISEPEGIVAIPIDEAMDIFVARVQADPRQASPPATPVASGNSPDEKVASGGSPDGSGNNTTTRGDSATQPAGAP
jgi:uncharacterized integral membrane protein